MKTGRDAKTAGLYVSECCLTEVTLSDGQMFPRCPACYALTVWEFVPLNEGTNGSPSSCLTANSGLD
jgi:hypothetical protein